MTNASASGSTSPGDEDPRAGESAERWEALIDELTDCGHHVLDRTSDRFRRNVKLAREGRYNLGAWLDDVRWFWQGVAQDTSNLVEGLRDPDPDRK